MTDEGGGKTEDRRSLLIVEDDDALAGYLAAALTDHGYTTRTASDRRGAQAALATTDPPVLILLDLGLPPQPSTMSEGLAVLDACLEQAPLCKVIVLTGQDEQVAAREAVRRGAFDFLVKPCALPTVLAALRRAEIFAREERSLALSGHARLTVTTRFDEGPRGAAAAVEEQLLRRTLATARYNVAETARRLGLAREHVYYYLNKYGIRRPD